MWRGSIDIMQISGHKNVASINNYSTLSEERHKKISNILSNTESETSRNAFQQIYLVKPPHILQPVALLMFRVEAIPMLLLTVPIQICQVKLVLCFTAWSSITNGECVHNFHKWLISQLLSIWVFDIVVKYISVNQFSLLR